MVDLTYAKQSEGDEKLEETRIAENRDDETRGKELQLKVCI